MIIHGENIAIECSVVREMDRRCSQSVRTLNFDDSDTDAPKNVQKKDLTSSGPPSSLNQSAEGGLYEYLLYIMIMVVDQLNWTAICFQGL